MSDSFKIMLIVQSIFWAGYFFGWLYVRRNEVAQLKQQNKNLRKVEVHEMITRVGSVNVRTSEWPLNAEEYLEFHSLERDGGVIEITFEGIESHMNEFARHLLARQKADFVKMCKEIPKGDKIKEELNS